MSGNASIAPLELTALTRLRGHAASKRLQEAARTVLGAAMPLGTGQCEAGNDWKILCLGPDTWLALSEKSASQVEALESALGNEHAAVLDVTNAWVAFRLHGSGTANILARGCAIDLDPRTLAGHAAICTLYRRVDVILLRHDSPGRVDLLVERSFGPYVWGHLRQDATLVS